MDIIIHADIPTLHLRKALRAGTNQTLRETAISFVSQKIPSFDIDSFSPHRKLETGIFVALDVDKTIQDLELKNHESIFFLKKSSPNEKTVHPALHKYKNIVPAGDNAASLLMANSMKLSSGEKVFVNDNDHDDDDDDEDDEFMQMMDAADDDGSSGENSDPNPIVNVTILELEPSASASNNNNPKKFLGRMMKKFSGNTSSNGMNGSKVTAASKVFGARLKGEIPPFLKAAIQCLYENCKCSLPIINHL